MRFFAAFAATSGLLATTVLADGVEINDALLNVAQWTAKLNESFVNYDGSLFGAPPILDVTSGLIAQIDKGMKIAKKSADLNTTEALAIYNTVLGLQTDVNITIDSVIKLKPEFDHWRFGGIIYLTLKLVKKETDSLSGAILKKVPSTLDSVAKPAVAVIDGYFDVGIQAYADDN